MKLKYYASWVIINLGFWTSVYLFTINFSLFKVLYSVNQPLITEVPHFSLLTLLGIFILSLVLALIPSKMGNFQNHLDAEDLTTKKRLMHKIVGNGSGWRV